MNDNSDAYYNQDYTEEYVIKYYTDQGYTYNQDTGKVQDKDEVQDTGEVEVEDENQTETDDTTPVNLRTRPDVIQLKVGTTLKMFVGYEKMYETGVG